tara:strand:- start:67 stop:399 length:333 start_codon:yes stop_codon:yes gene_type:complete
MVAAAVAALMVEVVMHHPIILVVLVEMVLDTPSAEALIIMLAVAAVEMKMMFQATHGLWVDKVEAVKVKMDQLQIQIKLDNPTPVAVVEEEPTGVQKTHKFVVVMVDLVL